MTRGRLEAFSDGVLAVIITIMVLELKAPHSADVGALLPLVPVLLSYVLSFIFIAIYWSNHHHLLQVVHRIDGTVLWANLHLLFWLSLTPFVTNWMGETYFATIPVACYGVVLMLSGIAYYVLAQVLLTREGPNSKLARALGDDLKGKLSVMIYVIAIPLAWVDSRISCGFYVAVAFIWLAPDRRIEKVVNHTEARE